MISLTYFRLNLLSLADFCLQLVYKRDFVGSPLALALATV